MSLEDNKAVVRRFFDELWNQHKLELAEELLSPGHVAHTPDPGHKVRGLNDAKQYITQFRRAYPDLRFSIEEMFGEGDKVFVRYTCNGTNRGEKQGHASHLDGHAHATGKPIALVGMAEFHFEQGKIGDLWVLWDRLDLSQQLGVTPAQAPAAR